MICSNIRPTVPKTLLCLLKLYSKDFHFDRTPSMGAHFPNIQWYSLYCIGVSDQKKDTPLQIVTWEKQNHDKRFARNYTKI